MSDKASNELQGKATSVNRRRMLKLGMAAAPAIVTLKASPASAARSIPCSIPVADHTGGYYRKPWKNVKHNGELTEEPVGGTEDIVPPPSKRVVDEGELVPGYTSEDLLQSSGTIPEHHLNYIRNLDRGQRGFTCFASIRARGII